MFWSRFKKKKLIIRERITSIEREREPSTVNALDLIREIVFFFKFIESMRSNLDKKENILLRTGMNILLRDYHYVELYWQILAV